MLLDREAGYLSSSLGVAVRSFFPFLPLSPVPVNLNLLLSSGELARSNQSNPPPSPLNPIITPIPIPPLYDSFTSSTFLFPNPFRHLPLFHSQPPIWIPRIDRRFNRDLVYRQIGSKTEMGENYALDCLLSCYGSFSLQVEFRVPLF